MLDVNFNVFIYRPSKVNLSKSNRLRQCDYICVTLKPTTHILTITSKNRFWLKKKTREWRTTLNGNKRLVTVLTGSLWVSLDAFAASVGGRGDLRPRWSEAAGLF